VPFDQLKPRQVNASKRLVFYVPFREFSLRKPQMEKLQAILHLFVFKKKRKRFQLLIEICQKKELRLN
jgi:myo-inositol catabolism protein IolC